MTFSFFFVILSVFFYLAGIIPYLYHVFHGRVVPHPFSWTVWAILAAINTLGLIAHTGLSFLSISPIISTIALCIGSIMGWFLIKKIKITIFDYICLFLALGVIAIAYFEGLSKAIIPSICIDLLLLAPTVKKFWKNPRSEDAFGWLGAGISRGFILLSLGIYALSYDSIWWWYSVSINIIIAMLIFYRTRYIENWINRIRNFFPFFVFKKKIW